MRLAQKEWELCGFVVRSYGEAIAVRYKVEKLLKDRHVVYYMHYDRAWIKLPFEDLEKAHNAMAKVST